MKLITWFAFLNSVVAFGSIEIKIGLSQAAPAGTEVLGLKHSIVSDASGRNVSLGLVDKKQDGIMRVMTVATSTQTVPSHGMKLVLITATSGAGNYAWAGLEATSVTFPSITAVVHVPYCSDWAGTCATQLDIYPSGYWDLTPPPGEKICSDDLSSPVYGDHHCFGFPFTVAGTSCTGSPSETYFAYGSWVVDVPNDSISCMSVAGVRPVLGGDFDVRDPENYAYCRRESGVCFAGRATRLPSGQLLYHDVRSHSQAKGARAISRYWTSAH